MLVLNKKSYKYHFIELFNFYILIAEDEGFKPPIPKSGIPDFESSAFDHSANLPLLCAKLIILFRLRKNIFRYLLVLCTYNKHISVTKKIPRQKKCLPR